MTSADQIIRRVPEGAIPPVSGLKRMDTLKLNQKKPVIRIFAQPGELDTAMRRGSGIIRPIPDQFKPREIIESGSFTPDDAPKTDHLSGAE
jgi:hypothetical protein